MQIPSRCIKLKHFHEVRVAYHNLFAPFNFLLFWIREETKKASSHFNENISFFIEHYGNAQFLFHFTATEQQSGNKTRPVKVVHKNSSRLQMMSLLFWYLTTVISTAQQNKFIRLLFSGNEESAGEKRPPRPQYSGPDPHYGRLELVETDGSSWPC